MGKHKSISDLQSRTRLFEIPFGDTISRIEQLRSELDEIRSKPPRRRDLEATVLEMEDKLRSAYAELAAEAASKVAKWEKGPKRTV